jgi:hypothetical protein
MANYCYATERVGTEIRGRKINACAAYNVCRQQKALLPIYALYGSVDDRSLSLLLCVSYFLFSVRARRDNIKPGKGARNREELSLATSTNNQTLFRFYFIKYYTGCLALLCFRVLFLLLHFEFILFSLCCETLYQSSRIPAPSSYNARAPLRLNI